MLAKVGKTESSLSKNTLKCGLQSSKCWELAGTSVSCKICPLHQKSLYVFCGMSLPKNTQWLRCNTAERVEVRTYAEGGMVRGCQAAFNRMPKER